MSWSEKREIGRDIGDGYTAVAFAAFGIDDAGEFYVEGWIEYFDTEEGEAPDLEYYSNYSTDENGDQPYQFTWRELCALRYEALAKSNER